MTRKPTRNFRRNPKNRKQKEYILIVCEGEVTEFKYFEECVKFYGLSRYVDVNGGGGTDWESVLNHAKGLMRTGKSYDRVYCVVDIDGKNGINEFIAKATKTKIGNAQFKCIHSMPCFEFWILCHFDQCLKPFKNCPDVVRTVRKHIPNYDKTQCHINIDENIIKKAIDNSYAILKSHQQTGSSNPLTHVHVVVEDLIKLSEQE
jgi:hypothetical protein